MAALGFSGKSWRVFWNNPYELCIEDRQGTTVTLDHYDIVQIATAIMMAACDSINHLPELTDEYPTHTLEHRGA